MGKSVTIDQSQAVIAILQTNVDWEALDGDVLQEKIVTNPTEAGRQFTLFLKNGGKVIIGEPRIIPIDRSRPFDPVSFIGKGWSIWKGPIDGKGLKGDEEQDERSLVLSELDLTKVQLKTMLRDNESSIKGEEKLRRLKEAGHIRLDARIFQTLWENQYPIPEKWKEKTRGYTTFIYFDGTILRNPDGCRYILSLCWGDGSWYWHYYWLEDDWRVHSQSALLASS